MRAPALAQRPQNDLRPGVIMHFRRSPGCPAKPLRRPAHASIGAVRNSARLTAALGPLRTSLSELLFQLSPAADMALHFRDGRMLQ
jgi:hypothetical protein